MDNEHNYDNEKEKFLTTNQGQRVNHTDDHLRAGQRGPMIMDDHHFREKMTHFDHERIPERVVHARGSAAHGVFEAYGGLEKYTRASFLKAGKKTEVFTRFSTVVGSRGSADTVRDVRGFAVKFYTEEGNYDLVGNNMPIFFIQDGIKFPDLVHAIKPEPHHEMPQASAAHDSFWDFISLMPESMHMIMWVLSDRALPRSYSAMEGFGVHTFRLINEQGQSHFVKFHWKPTKDLASLVWDETQKIAGKDPDFNRKDLWESIEMGNYPEYELCLQILPEEDEHKFGFDILDATKIWPEELVPLVKAGKMTLNRNPDNFFNETEQVAFHPGHLVPGIDLSNDPLLQGRLFSYLDTQLLRLGGPNFAEIPINSPHIPVNNNQQDGFHRRGNTGKVNYFPNSRASGCPMMAAPSEGGYVHYPEPVSGVKTRERAEGFKDFYSQATLFWNSMTGVEKQHIVEAAWFELGKVTEMAIRERVVEQFARIDHDLAIRVAGGIGVERLSPARVEELQKEQKNFVERVWKGRQMATESPALSMEKTKKADSIQGRKIGILAEPGANATTITALKDWLKSKGAMAEVVSSKFGDLDGVKVDKSYITTASVLYDSIVIVDGEESLNRQVENGETIHFINEIYKHCKTIATVGKGQQLLSHTALRDIVTSYQDATDPWEEKGVVGGSGLDSGFLEKYEKALAVYRHWQRGSKDTVPA